MIKVTWNKALQKSKTFFMLSLVIIIMTILVMGIYSYTDLSLPNGDLAGFFMGIWHGMVVVISFIGSLISDSFTIYEINNTGHWYDFGYLLGLSMLPVLKAQFKKK